MNNLINDFSVLADEVQILFSKKYKQEKLDFHKSFLIDQETQVLGYKRNQSSILNKQVITNQALL